jgi:hypothetical protein
MMQSQSTNGRKINYVLVDSILECIKVVEEVLMKETIISLDCEGVFLSKEGQLTLLQVSILFILLHKDRAA